MSKKRVIVTWCGVPLEDMSKNQLIDALTWAGEMIEGLLGDIEKENSLVLSRKKGKTN